MKDPQSPDRDSYRHPDNHGCERTCFGYPQAPDDGLRTAGRAVRVSQPGVGGDDGINRSANTSRKHSGWSHRRHARQPGMPPDRVEAPAEAVYPADIAEELQVVAALHQVGADLGDPVEIARTAGRSW